MMTLSDVAGYVASTMVLLTFLTKDMRLLRGLAILSNIAFVTYGMLVWLPPVFCLHLLLLPINAVRLREMLTASSSPLPAMRPRTLNGRSRSTSPRASQREVAHMSLSFMPQLYSATAVTSARSDGIPTKLAPDIATVRTHSVQLAPTVGRRAPSIAFPCSDLRAAM